MSCIFEMSLPLCKGCTTRRDCWCCDKMGDWIRDRIDIEQHGDLISRSALLDAMRDTEFTTYFPLDEIDSVIDCAPAVDAIEVVRCKDWQKQFQIGTGGRTMKTPEEIKKALECCSDADGFDGDCIKCPYKCEQWCGDKSKIDALAYIRQLEATQPKWISVEERLPEPNTIVLLIAHGWEPQLVYIGKLEKVESERSWLTGLVSKASEWTVYGFSYLKEPIVTHWMPLPSMPEPQKEDA